MPGFERRIRAVGKAASGLHGLEVIGIRDGFLGLIEERFITLDRSTLGGILTVGGTILGTSRIKPHRMDFRGKIHDMRDVILIPEIPYDARKIAKAIQSRSRNGTNFSIVAVAEGALSQSDAIRFKAARTRRVRASSPAAVAHAKAALSEIDRQHAGNTMRLAARLERLTGLESRVTILGYVQRGGAPSANDRLLATRLGTACARLIRENVFGVMVASRGDCATPVPIEQVAEKRKQVTLDHPWIAAARAVGTCLGD